VNNYVISLLVSADQLPRSEVHHVRAGCHQDGLVQPRQGRNPGNHFTEQDHRPWTVRHQTREGKFTKSAAKNRVFLVYKIKQLRE